MLESLGLSEVWLRAQYQRHRIDASQRRRASMLRGSWSRATIWPPPTPGRCLTCHAWQTTSRISVVRVGDNAARPFQEYCRTLDGDVILRAPTGSGKTCAAALWAIRNQAENGRFFYALPHTASINAMYNRLRQWFSGDQEWSVCYTIGVLRFSLRYWKLTTHGSAPNGQKP